MTLTDNGDLAIAELVYWVPALALALFVTFKHGFGRQVGFFFIVLLALARLIGASCTVASEEMTTPNESVIAAAAITSTIGVSFLIQAMLGLLTRVTDGTPDILHVPSRVFRLLHIMLLVGVIIGIVGGSDLAEGGSKSSTGSSLLKASVILFLVGMIIIGLGLAIVTLNLRRVPSGEKRLVFACLVAFPFIFVRLLYSIISVFVEDKTFNYYDPDIWVRAFMAVFEEFVAAGIILVTGVLAQKIERGDVQRDAAGAAPSKYQETGYVQNNGYSQNSGHVQNAGYSQNGSGRV